MSDYSATFPSQRPVFTQDFAQSGKIDPRATFSRSDSPIDVGKAAASAVHYWSNEKHLSSENLIPNSNASQAWQTVRVTRTTSGSFLDGSNSFLIAEKSDTGSHYTSPNSSVNATNFVSGTEYTAVVYAKAGTDNVIQLAFSAGYFTSNAYANFDLSNASTTPVTGSAATATITALGSDWVKLTLTAPATATGAAVGVVVAFIENDINGARIPVYAGDTASNVYIWEANVSSTGQTVLDPTSGQIHRAYAPTLKSPATAGAARFEHDPATNVSKGILIESQGSNLIASSEDLTTTWITSRSSVLQNCAIAPSGVLDADALIDDGTASNNHNIRQEFTISSTGDHTASMYAKPLGRDYLTVFFSNYGGKFSDEYAIINLTNGSVGTTSGTISASAESVGNGWYRIQATASANSTGTARLTLLTAASSSSYTHDGDSFSGVAIWGVQFEEGAFASSYVQTLLSAKTRAADNLTVDLTQAGYTGGPVSVITETTGGQGSYPRTFSLSDGTITNYANIHRNGTATDTSTNYRVRLFTDGASQVDRTASGSASATKIGMSIDTNSVISTFDGGSSATDSSAVINTMTELRIGDQPNGGKQLNGTCKRISVYGTALSQTELEALTS